MDGDTIPKLGCEMGFLAWLLGLPHGLWAMGYGLVWINMGHIFCYCWRSSGNMGDVFGMFNEVFCISLRQIQYWNVAIPGPWLPGFPLG